MAYSRKEIELLTPREVVALTLKDCDNHRALGQPLSGLMISGYAAHNAETIMNDTSGLYSEEVKAKYSKATFGKSFVDSFKARFQFRGLREIEVQAFALEDERSWSDDEEDGELLEDGDLLEEEENGEDVVIEDPSELIGLVKRLQTYFRNTACPEEVCVRTVFYVCNLGRVNG